MSYHSPDDFMYSQNSEESVICEYFAGSPIGRLLDIGAWVGKELSNSLRLTELGWSAVLVEPDPPSCAALLKLHLDNPRIQIVNAALAPEAGWQIFYECNGDAVSTMNIPHRDKWAGTVKYQPMHLWAVTPMQLLNRFPGPFDMVTLDIEGMNLPILQQLPLAEMQTRLACVEHDGHQDQVIKYCDSHGLTDVLLHNGENLILARPK